MGEKEKKRRVRTRKACVGIPVLDDVSVLVQRLSDSLSGATHGQSCSS